MTETNYIKISEGNYPDRFCLTNDRLIHGISEQFSDILNDSYQGIYIYLDEHHKVFNERFASLLGYDAKELTCLSENFLDSCVTKKSKEVLTSAYDRATRNLSASKFYITWIKKDGGLVDTQVILVPIEYEGQILALHFLSIK